jgi:hypothetical protein
LGAIGGMNALPLQKINLHYLLTDFALQFGHTAFGPASLPVTRKAEFLARLESQKSKRGFLAV